MTTTTHAAAAAVPAKPATHPGEMSLGEHVVLAWQTTDLAVRTVLVGLVGLLIALSAALGLLAPHVLR
ncbi:MAG TPA: hypothetical protein VG276_28765 [Actinomycetes bacterium]|jgi:hypothetical protein|nr:hypothetical protein [Actinomycetes bacterium]